MVNISESRASLTGALFFGNNAEFRQNGILGQSPTQEAEKKLFILLIWTKFISYLRFSQRDS